MQNTFSVSQEEFDWIVDAIGYGNVSSVGAAYSRLVSYRNKIEQGCIIRFMNDNQCEFSTTENYDAWIRNRFPVFIDDQLHPVFNPGYSARN